MTVSTTWGWPGGSVVKNLPASAGDIEPWALSPASGRSPGGGNDNPCHGETHGQRIPAGYSPRSPKGFETATEHAFFPAGFLLAAELLWKSRTSQVPWWWRWAHIKPQTHLSRRHSLLPKPSKWMIFSIKHGVLTAELPKATKSCCSHPGSIIEKRSYFIPFIGLSRSPQSVKQSRAGCFQ